jgi:hypothetical protein
MSPYLNATIEYSLSDGAWVLDLSNSIDALILTLTVEQARQCVVLGIEDMTADAISKMIPPQQVLFT